MKKILIIALIVPLTLISCGKSEEVKTVVNTPVAQKQVTTTVPVVVSPVVATGSVVDSSTEKIGVVTTEIVSGSGMESNSGNETKTEDDKILKIKGYAIFNKYCDSYGDGTCDNNKSVVLIKIMEMKSNFDKKGNYKITTNFSKPNNQILFGCLDKKTNLITLDTPENPTKKFGNFTIKGDVVTKLKESTVNNPIDLMLYTYPTYLDGYGGGLCSSYFYNIELDTKNGKDENNNFSDSQIRDILVKIDENTKKHSELEKNNTGVLIQGDYRAEYIPNENNVDKLKIIINGKEKIFELASINNTNIEVNKLFSSGECNKENFDLPKCAKNEFGGFYKFYNNGTYLGYFDQGYEAGSLIIISTDSGKELYSAFDASSCSLYLNNSYITCTYFRGDGELGVHNLSTGKDDMIGINTSGSFLDEKFIYTKEGNIFKIYDLKSLKQIFSKEITK